MPVLWDRGMLILAGALVGGSLAAAVMVSRLPVQALPSKGG
jgi:hypothetical protein